MVICMSEFRKTQMRVTVPGCEVLNDHTEEMKQLLLWDVSYIWESCTSALIALAIHTLLQPNPHMQYKVAMMVTAVTLLYIIVRRARAWRLGKGYRCLHVYVKEPADVPLFCKIVHVYADDTVLVMTKVRRCEC